MPPKGGILGTALATRLSDQWPDIEAVKTYQTACCDWLCKSDQWPDIEAVKTEETPPSPGVPSSDQWPDIEAVKTAF